VCTALGRAFLIMENGIHIALSAELLGTLWGIPITNALVTTWASMALLFGLVFLLRRKIKLIPGRIQTAVEWGLEVVANYVEEALGSPERARRYFPLIATIFIFVLFLNELAFLPIFGSVGFFHGHEFTPLLRPGTADLNTTLALSIIAFLTIEISGILTLGVLKYGSKFVNFKAGFIGVLVGIVELIGNLARLISLSFRLFGNIFAGEVLILVISSFAPLLAPLPFILFEMFVGFLQAIIFALLTLAFIQIAVAEPHEAH